MRDKPYLGEYIVRTHNTDPERTGETWANRVAYTQSLRATESGRLRRVAKDRIVEFAESIDDIFMAYESIQGDNEEPRQDNDAIAIGVYYFEERDSGALYDW